MSESIQCLSGMLIGDPRLTINPVGRCRFTAPFETVIGWSGRHTDSPADLTADLVVVGPAAERAYAQFTAGDRFLAEGTWIHLPDLPEIAARRPEFIARHLGRDLTQRRYAVDRTRRSPGWQPHAPAHLLTEDWAAPLLGPVGTGRRAAS